jgi:hypothetical protein
VRKACLKEDQWIAFPVEYGTRASMLSTRFDKLSTRLDRFHFLAVVAKFRRGALCIVNQRTHCESLEGRSFVAKAAAGCVFMRRPDGLRLAPCIAAAARRSSWRG